jgi:hypothetical protein
MESINRFTKSSSGSVAKAGVAASTRCASSTFRFVPMRKLFYLSYHPRYV